MDVQISNFLKILRMIFDEKCEFSLNEPADWACLSELARKQNLLPLFFEIASRSEAYVTSDGYTKDQLDTFAMVAAQIQRSSAFLDIYGKITAQGIYPIVMKGIVCRQLYGELGEHRPSGDEDILVEVKDFPKVKEILEQENYICSVPVITERSLEQIHEISFYNLDQKLNLDVHINAIGKENEDRARMNRLFQDVHEHGQRIRSDGVDIKVLEPTESLLFLIVHAYKHFLSKGVGFRQVLDTLLYYRKYKSEIKVDRLQEALKYCKAELFWMDILYIGNEYLGLYEARPEQICCPEELLQDMMQAGVFGGREKADFVAANVNLAAENGTNRQGKIHTLIRAAFPSRQVLLA
ncbi:MAG: nucleotidyltransferase family protein, partial [Lachnospiraceae bacterium]|nr:nucleotidyltransferase family protein [Lachnospiraceae bacterium]